MDVYQMAFNGLGSVAMFLFGYMLNSIGNSIKGLQTADNLLSDKIQHLEILVAGDYVKKHDLTNLTEALFAKLDKIEDKLDRKADK